MHETGREGVAMWCGGVGTTCQDSPVARSFERRNKPQSSNARNLFRSTVTISFTRTMLRGGIQTTYMLGPRQLSRYYNYDTDERPTDAIIFPHRTQTGSGAHPVSYSETNGTLSAEVKRSRCNPDHSLSSSAEN
jgi:hypothetical protein